MGLNFRRFGALFVVVSITFPILVTFTLIHQNSVFDIVEGFSKINVFAGKAQNASTTTVLKQGAQNITVKAGGGNDQNITESAVVTTTVLKQGAQNIAVKAGGGNDQNISESAVDKLLGHKDQNGMPGIFQERAQTQTISDIGPQNHSLEDQKNGPSLSTTSIANDQFLDGLLVSTFDEASCLSRYQSHLYRKASPYKPSAYLISKLRKYEYLHRSCGPRTKSLAAAFLYAILTDRVLLVKFGADMFGLFCEPFPDSSWLLPRNFPYWKDQKHIETYESMLMNSKKNSSKELLPQFLILNLLPIHDGHNNFFHCDQSQGLLQKVPVIILRSNQYFVPSLFMISSFRQDLSRMFPEKDTVFHHLGRYLFHPSNEAWELISKFYEAHLAKANERIGLQIRVYNTHKAPHQTIINEIISCTRQHKLLPELDVQKTSTSPLKKQTSKVVLVTSLYSEYGEKLRTMYMANTKMTSEVVKVYQPSHEGHQKSNNDTHNIQAWSEIYLLSLCDVLIKSPKSTFGYVAQSLGGLKPWILHRAYGETIPDPPCQRAISMEPCFHYPPKYDCRANNAIDFTSLFHHMKHCEDVRGGLRLVNA